MRKLIVVFAMAASSAMAGEFITHDDAMPGRYLVVLKEGVVQQVPGTSVAAQATSIASMHGGRVGRLLEHALQGFELYADEKAARAVARDPRVAVVDQDRYMELAATQSLPHWGLDRIDERDRPRNNHFTYSTTGAGVNIYILDTGINANTQFGTRLRNTHSEIVDANGTPLFNDCNALQHGTNVALLAGGSIAGVAKGATIHNIRIGSVCPQDCPQPTGAIPENRYGPSTSTGGCLNRNDIVLGMNWVAANRVRPAVANLSLEGGVDAQIDQAVRNLHNAGVVVVSAAGNRGEDACNVSPARVPESITTGASDINDARAIYSGIRSSNTGLCVDLFAPGKDVNGFTGTSSAAPHVAGAAALYLQSNPSASPATVASHLINNATPGSLSGIGSSPNRLLFVTPGGTETDNPPVAYGFSCTCNGGRTCTFTNPSYSDDFGVSTCRYYVGEDQWNRLILKYGCGTVTYTYPYSDQYYQVGFQVIDDAGQVSGFVYRQCQ